jgi:hypothetical protein
LGKSAKFCCSGFVFGASDIGLSLNVVRDVAPR